jgi:hypothetical protein
LELSLADLTDEAVRSSEASTNHAPSETTSGQPAKKKAKKDRLLGYKLHDPCRLWIHIKEFESMDDGGDNSQQKSILVPEALPTVMGAKLCELSVAGIMNGFARVTGGFVDKFMKPIAATEIETPQTGKITLLQLKNWATALHQSVQTRLEKDVLETTPLRIAHMLCPDLSPAEFKSVRRRIYDTVILGKGLKGEDIQDDIPVANTSQSVHDIEKVRKKQVKTRHSLSFHAWLTFFLDGSATVERTFACSSKNAKTAATMINLHSFSIGRMEMSFAAIVELLWQKASCMRGHNSVNSKGKSIAIIMEMRPIHCSVRPII